jgi:hypothetical protein
MALSIPAELAPPLVGVTACASRIALSILDLDEADIPPQRIEEIAETADGKFVVRLIREVFDNKDLHFHIDVQASKFITIAKTNGSVDAISTKFDRLIGKTLAVNFESRFMLTPETKQPGLIGFMQTIGVNFGGTTGKLAGASLRLDDSTFREVRWKNAKVQNESYFAVEVLGTLGPVSVSSDLLSIVAERAFQGFKRFILPQAPTTAAT